VNPMTHMAEATGILPVEEPFSIANPQEALVE